MKRLIMTNMSEKVEASGRTTESSITEDDGVHVNIVIAC